MRRVWIADYTDENGKRIRRVYKAKRDAAMAEAKGKAKAATAKAAKQKAVVERLKEQQEAQA